MALLDRVPLLAKALLPLVIMGSVFSVTLAVGVFQMADTVGAYRQILAHSSPAVLRMTQLSHLISEVGYSIDRNLVFVCRTKDAGNCERANRDFISASVGGERVIAEAIRFDPDRSADYEHFRQEFRDCVRPTAKAMAFGMRDDNEAAKAIMIPVNDRILKLRDELDTYASRRAGENRAQGLALGQRAMATLRTMIIAGVAAAVIGLALAAWVAVVETTAPLTHLTRSMVQLANGNLAVEILGQNRRDEIGAMARALHIFKDNAKAKLEAEIEALLSREAAAQAARQAQTEMARVARVLSIGELASSIAHEISQPIAAIITNNRASMRWMDHSPPEMDRARAAIERSLRDGERAGAVIQRVRSMIAKTEPTFSDLNINTLVGQALDFTEDERRRAHVRLDLQLEQGLPCVKGDAIQLQQVLLNLILNGLDALRERGPDEKVLSIASGLDSDGCVTVTVRDNGPGVEPSQKGQLFEPFFTTKTGGVGLGLPISRSIIETHGGKIWAQPAAPHGATFAFSLPASSPAAAPVLG